MKKLLIALLFLIPIISFGQRTYETGSLITDTDTTIFIKFFSYGDYSITFDYSTYDQDDWTLSLGNSNDGTGFDKLDDSRLPYTLDLTTNSYTDETGETRATVTFVGNAWRSRYLGIQIDITSAGTDTLNYTYVKE